MIRIIETIKGKPVQINVIDSLTIPPVGTLLELVLLSTDDRPPVHQLYEVTAVQVSCIGVPAHDEPLTLDHIMLYVDRLSD